MKLFVAFLLLTLAAAQECTDFAKNGFTGGVQSRSQCADACRTAEGLTRVRVPTCTMPQQLPEKKWICCLPLDHRQHSNLSSYLCLLRAQTLQSGTGEFESWRECTGELTVGNETTVGSGGRCQCRVPRTNNYRSVCQDSICSGSAIMPSMLLAALVAAAALYQM